MKKVLALVALVITTLAFCACSSTGASTTGNASPANATTAQSSQSDSPGTPAASYVLNEYTKDGTVSGGYSYRATLKIGPWVKASDTKVVNDIWKQIGGSGSVPNIDNFTYNNWSSGVRFSAGTSIMAFGTVSVTDTTQGGFSIGGSSSPLSIDVTSPELNKALMCDSYVGYSGGNGDYYLHSVEGARGANYILHVVPDMTGKKWGPVPFVICCNEALSPENPDGDPDAINATWRFGDTTFTVSPMWAD